MISRSGLQESIAQREREDMSGRCQIRKTSVTMMIAISKLSQVQSNSAEVDRGPGLVDKTAGRAGRSAG